METRNIVLVSVVFLMSGLLGFAVVQSQYGSDNGYTLDSEVNTTHFTSTMDIYNNSVDMVMVDGLNASFYLDLEQDGSPSIVMEDLERDGRVHATSQTLDFRSGVYRLDLRYQDNSSQREDAWMRAYRVQKID